MRVPLERKVLNENDRIAATLRVEAKPSRVRSSRAVLPDPGELIRFRQKVPLR